MRVSSRRQWQIRVGERISRGAAEGWQEKRFGTLIPCRQIPRHRFGYRSTVASSDYQSTSFVDKGVRSVSLSVYSMFGRLPSINAQGTNESQVSIVCGAPHEVWHQHPFQVNAPAGSTLQRCKSVGDERNCSQREERYLGGKAERAFSCSSILSARHALPVACTAGARTRETAKSSKTMS